MLDRSRKRTTVQAWTSQDTKAPPFSATIVTRDTQFSVWTLNLPRNHLVCDNRLVCCLSGTRQPLRSTARIFRRDGHHSCSGTNLQSQMGNISATVKYVGLEQDGAKPFIIFACSNRLNPAAGLGNLDVPTEFFINSQTLLPTKLIYAIRAPPTLRPCLSCRLNTLTTVPSMESLYRSRSIFSRWQLCE